jgi:DNA-binding MarR family transcriptional regulator
MTDTPTLTGQDIGEAQGAVTGLLDRIVAGNGSTSTEYIALRVLAGRGPWASAEALRDYLAGQPQLDLDQRSAATLLDGLWARGLITSDGSGDAVPVQLTAVGTDLHAGLGRAVAEVTGELYAGIDRDDLATAHRVLVQVTERAGQLRAGR